MTKIVILNTFNRSFSKCIPEENVLFLLYKSIENDYWINYVIWVLYRYGYNNEK